MSIKKSYDLMQEACYVLNYEKDKTEAEKLLKESVKFLMLEGYTKVEAEETIDVFAGEFLERLKE